MKEYKCTDKNITRVGRTYLSGDDVLWCGLSGTGIVFETDSDEVSITFVGDSSTRGQYTEGQARVAIYVDGERACEFMMTEPMLTKKVEGLKTAKRHLIQVVKLSEAAMSIIGIEKVEIGEGMSVFRKELPDLKIEFVGDSITCGYGVDMPDPLVPFKTETEDCTKAYAMRTAGKLGAAANLVSYSGYGIVSGYTSNDEKLENELVPPYYEKTAFSYAATDKGEYLQDVPWDFSEFEPAVVVVNLGTNDASYCKDIPERLDDYAACYVEFLKTIHKRNPKAKLLLTLGLMSALSFDTVERVAEEFRTQTGFEDIFTVELELQKPEDGLVSDYHPTCVSHEKAACTIERKIREMLAIG